jgi:phosphoenolpyruvate-protein kinase (PTS system EI component)
MVTIAIEAATRAGKKIGICGQAPSDYPEFARFLVEKGITSIALNPDTVLQTTHVIVEAEAEAKLTASTATKQPVLMLTQTKPVDSAVVDPLILSETGV